jgi:hypothetical protein
MQKFCCLHHIIYLKDLQFLITQNKDLIIILSYHAKTEFNNC